MWPGVQLFKEGYASKYFSLPGKRRRYKRAHQVRGPPSLEEQLPDHVGQQDGPQEYTLVKERKSHSTPKKGRKKRGVGRRMIIDIHLEVLDECQKGDVALTKEDYFTILVQEFMGSNFIKEVQCLVSDSGFREEDLVPKEGVPKEDITMEQVPGLRFQV
ncbi:SICA antigen [Plasmodium coatneyi]|uniref:SICA antigen n=1 Tax=Plasmodium coatneyi TaxID=208452 RepID=A0A1B1DSM1_9APIC|nr:SICA antigen [Plasmodium coatneyi]ANQ05734.1 SICA antigen [Plasmodium coatneyi]